MHKLKEMKITIVVSKFVGMKMLCPASMNISGMVWYEVRLIAFLSQKWATEWTWTLLSLFTNTLVRLAKS